MCAARTGLVVGIDLGTTSLRVGVWQNDRVEVIPNNQGAYSTPSCVAFTDTECLIGEAAEYQRTRNACNTVLGINRLVGRKFLDPELQEDMKYWPFKVVCGPGDNPLVKVQYQGKAVTFQAEEILAMLLSGMRGMAERYTDKEVRNAVITAPVQPNYTQRQAVRDAGTIAGLNVLRFIDGPTAASIAHGLDTTESAPRNVLIYDCGGGTLDVSLVAIDKGIFEVKATAGDPHLGGEDFDNRLGQYFLDHLQVQYRKDLRSSDRAMARLHLACERAKRALSVSTKAFIELDALYDDVNVKSTVVRTRYEGLCGDLLRRMMHPVEKVLRDAKMAISTVDEVVVVGGLAYIPKVRQLLTDFSMAKHSPSPFAPMKPLCLVSPCKLRSWVVSHPPDLVR